MVIRHPRLLSFLFAVPILLALEVARELRDHPMHRMLAVDERTYHEAALSISRGDWHNVVPFWQPPLYPVCLAACYWIFEPRLWLVFLLQAACFGAIALSTYHLASRISHSRRAGLLAWLLISTNGTLIFFTSQLLNAVMATTLVTGSAVAMLHVLDGSLNRPRLLFLAAAGGVLTGLAAITAAPCALLVIFYWALLYRSCRDAIAHFAICALAPIILTTAMNFSVSHEFIPIASSGGINFWIGNNPQYAATTGIRPGLAWQELTHTPLAAGVTKPGAQSAYFVKQALSWMWSHKQAAVALIMLKFKLCVSGYEVARNQEIYPFRACAALLRSLLWVGPLAWPFGVLFPLACLGVGLSVRRGEVALGLVLLIGVAACLLFSCVLFFVADRYRLPAHPCLAALSGYGLDRLLRCLSERRIKAALVPTGVAVGAFFLANCALPEPPATWNSDAYRDLGVSRLELGDSTAARALFQQALDADSTNLDAANDLGVLLATAGRHEEAVKLFDRVLSRYPSNGRTRMNLAFSHFQQGRVYRAGEDCRIAMLGQPPEASAEANLNLCNEIADDLEAQALHTDSATFVSSMLQTLQLDSTNVFLRGRVKALLQAQEH